MDKNTFDVDNAITAHREHKAEVKAGAFSTEERYEGEREDYHAHEDRMHEEALSAWEEREPAEYVW